MRLIVGRERPRDRSVRCDLLQRPLFPVVMAATLLAGCGGSGQTTNLPGPTTPPSGIVLSGNVPGVVGAKISLYHVQPAGTIGEAVDPLNPAPSFPLPPHAAFATTQTDSAGNFQLTLPDNRPVAVHATGGQGLGLGHFALKAMVTTPGQEPVFVTPFTTMSTRAALVAMRGGRPVADAIEQSNDSLATYLGLASLNATSPGGSSEDSKTYAAELSALAREALDEGLDPLDLIARLGNDLSDGTFDGLADGNTIFVLTTDGGRVPLPPTLMTSVLQAASVQPKALAQSSSSGVVAPPPPQYTSPYSVNFTAPNLQDDFSQPPRSELDKQSTNPIFADWYNLAYWNSTNPGIISEQPWGPTPALYPAPVVPDLPAGITEADWMRQRVLATALVNVGLEYQHHHIPGWDPPTSWPYWLPVAAGANGPGVDCSDYSSWNYNYGLGFRLETGVAEQAAQTSVTGNGVTLNATTLLQATASSPPTDFDTIVQTLETGDLLYIRGEPTDAPNTNITHVIMWVGDLGTGTSDGVPLIIDSHGPVVKTQAGVTIPNGPNLRPFYENSWYHAAFDHAHRYISDDIAATDR